MVAATVGLLARGAAPPSAGARRSPPADGLTHGVGPYAAAPAADAVRAHPTCPRLAGVTLVGTRGDLSVLEQAAEFTCGLRTTAAIDRARRALDSTRATIELASFTLTGNESSALLGGPTPTVLINGGKFKTHGPERIVPLLIHEGTHLASGRVPTARDELDARAAELEACQALFGDFRKATRGCRDAHDLLAEGTERALADLRRAGYR